MQFPPDGAARSGILVELLLSLFSLGGEAAFPFTQLPWKCSLSPPCLGAAREATCKVSAPRNLMAPAWQVLPRTPSLLSPDTHQMGLTLGTLKPYAPSEMMPSCGQEDSDQESRHGVFSYKWELS
ncbi:unnamed protein product [Gulo gulo]|uniref:Uncharacterized protein n=1 Tax=Gulo gulo TaxID=48420 RepID=A0A9X9M0L2_GULGU|nr:unnamed protein product [Gulo gulo]